MSAIGSPGFPDRIIGEKIGLVNGVIQTAEQNIGRIFIPAGSLNVGDCFRALVSFGRDNGTDGYGTATNFRMGVLGTIADPLLAAANLSGLFAPAGSQLSTGIERWFRVVSIGANSVVELLGQANGASSWVGTASGAVVGLTATLTGYNLLTQDGWLSLTTTMAAATATRPVSGYMRLEADM
jgi:hypothetical protein